MLILKLIRITYINLLIIKSMIIGTLVNLPIIRNFNKKLKTKILLIINY